MQELLDALGGEVGARAVLIEAKIGHQVPELFLVEEAVAINVDSLVDLDEVREELLVLLQLEVEHALQKHPKLQLARLHHGLVVVEHGARLGPAPLLPCGRHQTRARRPYAPAYLSLTALRRVLVRLGLLGHELLGELALEEAEVLLVVHLLDDAAPLPILDEALPAEDLVDHFDERALGLLRVLFAEEGAQERNDRLLDRLLDETELFVALGPQDLAKESHIVILLLVLLDACYDRRRPFNDEILQPVALVEVRVHELLHGLARQPALFALLIELGLLLVDVVDEVAKLAQAQHPLLRAGSESRRDGALVEELSSSWLPCDSARRWRDRPLRLGATWHLEVALAVVRLLALSQAWRSQRQSSRRHRLWLKRLHLRWLLHCEGLLWLLLREARASDLLLWILVLGRGGPGARSVVATLHG